MGRKGIIRALAGPLGFYRHFLGGIHSVSIWIRPPSFLANDLAVARIEPQCDLWQGRNMTRADRRAKAAPEGPPLS
jgi:hypothetical protein